LNKIIEDNWKRRNVASLVVTIGADKSGELLFNGKPTTVAALKRWRH